MLKLRGSVSWLFMVPKVDISAVLSGLADKQCSRIWHSDLKFFNKLINLIDVYVYFYLLFSCVWFVDLEIGAGIGFIAYI